MINELYFKRDTHLDGVNIDLADIWNRIAPQPRPSSRALGDRCLSAGPHLDRNIYGFSAKKIVEMLRLIIK